MIYLLFVALVPILLVAGHPQSVPCSNPHSDNESNQDALLKTAEFSAPTKEDHHHPDSPAHQAHNYQTESTHPGHDHEASNKQGDENFQQHDHEIHNKQGDVNLQEYYHEIHNKQGDVNSQEHGHDLHNKDGEEHDHEIHNKQDNVNKHAHDRESNNKHDHENNKADSESEEAHRRAFDPGHEHNTATTPEKAHLIDLINGKDFPFPVPEERVEHLSAKNEVPSKLLNKTAEPDYVKVRDQIERTDKCNHNKNTDSSEERPRAYRRSQSYGDIKQFETLSEKNANVSQDKSDHSNATEANEVSGEDTARKGDLRQRLRDPASGAAVRNDVGSRVKLLESSRVCYACTSASNENCWAPDRTTTVKYCRKVNSFCVTRTYSENAYQKVVVRDCASSCDVPYDDVKYDHCSICSGDLCNGDQHNSASGFTTNMTIMLLVLGVSLKAAF